MILQQLSIIIQNKIYDRDKAIHCNREDKINAAPGVPHLLKKPEYFVRT